MIRPSTILVYARPTRACVWCASYNTINNIECAGAVRVRTFSICADRERFGGRLKRLGGVRFANRRTPYTLTTLASRSVSAC